MKTGVLVVLKQQKELTSGKYEGAIIYSAAIDNGDEGEIFIAKGQTPPEVDKELEYTIEETDFGNKIKPKKEFKKGFGGGFGAKADPAKTSSIEKQSCLKSAVEYVNGAGSKFGAFKPADVVGVAKIFHTWVHGGTDNEVKVAELKTKPDPTVKTGLNLDGPDELNPPF